MTTISLDDLRGFSLVFFESWTGNEDVELIDTIPPADVTNLAASDVQASTLTLSWTVSVSPDVASYEVYQNSVLISTTSAASYSVTGLTAGTTYTFTVKSVDAAGNLSGGTSVQITTSSLQYHLAMNGTSDYVKIPTLKFDEIKMDFSAEPKKGSYSAYADASAGIGNALFGRNSAEIDFLQSAWRSVTVNGQDQTSAAGTAAIIRTNTRTNLTLALKSAGISYICIFANQLGSIPMKGNLYQVQIFLNGTIAASYDFTRPLSGSTIPDDSGNNHPAVLYGGTWVSN